MLYYPPSRPEGTGGLILLQRQIQLFIISKIFIYNGLEEACTEKREWDKELALEVYHSLEELGKMRVHQV